MRLWLVSLTVILLVAIRFGNGSTRLLPLLLLGSCQQVANLSRQIASDMV